MTRLIVYQSVIIEPNILIRYCMVLVEHNRTPHMVTMGKQAKIGNMERGIGGRVT